MEPKIISPEIIGKIKFDIHTRTRKDADVMPRMGISYYETQPEICISTLPQFQKYIIAVTRKIKYVNSSMKDVEIVYYPYNMKGKYLEKFNRKKMDDAFCGSLESVTT